MLRMGQNPLNFISKPQTVQRGSSPCHNTSTAGRGTCDQLHQLLGIRSQPGQPGQPSKLGSNLTSTLGSDTHHDQESSSTPSGGVENHAEIPPDQQIPQPSAHTLSHHHRLCPLHQAREGRVSVKGTNRAITAPPASTSLPGTSSAAASGQRSTNFSFLTAVIQSSNPSLTA